MRVSLFLHSRVFHWSLHLFLHGSLEYCIFSTRKVFIQIFFCVLIKMHSFLHTCCIFSSQFLHKLQFTTLKNLLIFLERQERGERERDINLLFHLLVHSLGASSVCYDQGSNPQPWHIGTTLQQTGQPSQGHGSLISKAANWNTSDWSLGSESTHNCKQSLSVLCHFRILFGTGSNRLVCTKTGRQSRQRTRQLYRDPGPSQGARRP